MTISVDFHLTNKRIAFFRCDFDIYYFLSSITAQVRVRLNEKPLSAKNLQVNYNLLITLSVAVIIIIVTIILALRSSELRQAESRNVVACLCTGDLVEDLSTAKSGTISS